MMIEINNDILKEIYN